ncbi:MAG: hypothetical protein AAGN46_11805 [Acidobacteriota bacterium]
MTAAHLHLAIAHLPVVLVPMALVLLILGSVLRREILAQTAYGVLLVAAVAAVFAYYSGPSTYEQLESVLAAEKPWVERHAVIARAAFVGAVLAAALALQAGLHALQGDPPLRWLRIVLVLLLLAVTYLFAWSAHLGGQIRHHEIRDGGTSILFPSLDD